MLRQLNLRLSIALLLAGFAGLGILAPEASADGAYQVASITPWMKNAAPVGWSSGLNRVIYNSRGANGLFDAYSANPDGSDPQCVTCTLPSLPTVGTATDRGVTDVSPNGQYMLATVATSRPPGSSLPDDTEPGDGAGNNIWLYTTDGQRAWQLTNLYQPGPAQGLAIIWPRFDRTGTEIVWASCYFPAIANLGYWELKVANIVWNNGVPSLANVRTIEPATNAFYEPYGFTPDDQHIIFASSAGQSSWLGNQIDTISTTGTGLTQLTQPTPGQANYNEFAFYTPSNNAIIYGGSRDVTSGGMDYWEMNPDGSDPQRLTYFAEPWSTEAMGYEVVESLAFNPNNPNQFVAAVSPSTNNYDVGAEMVTLAPNPAGLSEQFYAGTNFGQLLYTTTEDPSDGFEWDGSPAPNVPASNDSVAWIGTLTPPATGTYKFCIVAYPSGELYLGGKEVVNGLNTFGANECASVTATAGGAVPIQLDFEHGIGPAYGQLSWVPPGGSTPTPIPIADLTPVTTSSPPLDATNHGATTGATSATAGTAGASSGTSTAATTVTPRAAKHAKRSKNVGKRSKNVGKGSKNVGKGSKNVGKGSKKACRRARRQKKGAMRGSERRGVGVIASERARRQRTRG